MAEKMKGIICCEECSYFDVKQELCKVGNSVDNTDSRFFDDCILPDVAPVKHGKWLEELVPDGYVPKRSRTVKKCSVCGWTNACRYHYCPHCGTKMEVE